MDLETLRPVIVRVYKQGIAQPVASDLFVIYTSTIRFPFYTCHCFIPNAVIFP